MTLCNPRIVVLASGNGSNLQALLDAIQSGQLKAEIGAVIVNRRAAYAQKRATANNIHTEFFGFKPYLERHEDPAEARRRYDTDLAKIVSGHQPDLVVLAGWMHLFTSAFLNCFEGRVVNLHPALPGEFPGANAIDDAWQAHLNDGLERSGVMVHLVVDEGIDDGPLLASEVVPILVNDDRETFEARMHATEHMLLVRAVGDYLEQL